MSPQNNFFLHFIISQRESRKKGDEGKIEKTKKFDENEPSLKTRRKWSTKQSTTIAENEITKKNETSGGSQWVFARAQDRAKTREEEKRSDWVFERANDRKKFHDLMGSDWHTR
jgi:hypothetical protein